MQPRALTRLMQLSVPARLNVIAEGLGFLAEHVTMLRDDLVFLAEGEHPRARSILIAHAEEEAAKALILLDMVRAGLSDHGATRTLIGWFYSHLARCIYADLAHMRPATFREVRRSLRCGV
jgi:hypothetical protein